MAKIVKTIVIKGDTSDVDKKLKGLDQQVDKTSKTAKKTGKGLSGAFSGMGASIKAAIPSLQALKAAIISTGIGALVVGIGALGTVLKKANKIGADFSKGLSTLRAVTGNTADELKVLGGQAKQLGATTQFTAIEVVGLQTELAKLGFTIQDIKNSTPAILDLAASLEIDLANAAEFAGSVVRSFGLTTAETQRVVDVMAKSTSSSALNFEALKESLRVVAPVARATGVSIEQTAAYLGVLANNGLKGSVAGTGLSKSFIELNKKGIDINDAFEKVVNSSNGLGTAIELVGVVGAKSFLSLAEGTKDIEDLKVAFEDAEGAAKAMAEIRLDNLEGDTTKLSSAWDGFLLNIEDGEGILNKISRVAIQNLTESISRLTAVTEFAGFTLDYYFGDSDSAAEQEAGLSKRAANVGLFVGKMKKQFSTFKLFLADIPIIGRSIDVDKAGEELAQAVLMVDFANKKLKEISKLEEEGAKKGTFWQEWKNRKIIKSEEELQKVLNELGEEKKIKIDEETEAEADAEIQAEKDKQAALERIRKGLIDTEAEERAEKLRLIKADYDEQIKLAELYYGEETEKVKELREVQRLALEAQQLTFDEQDEAKKLAKQQKKAEELELDKAFEEAIFEEQRAILAERRETLKNDETLTDEQKLELTKQYKAADKKLDDIEFAGKEKMMAEAMDLANKAQALAGKNTVAGKAIGIATATVNTFQGASEALKQKSTLPSPFDVVAKVANVATVLATGLKTVKSIASVNVPGGGGSGGGTPSGGGSIAAPAPPSFNVVGASDTNQLADAIGGQTQQPVQAYVVANDVTTAQSLQNNIVEGATIG
tara:strand:+ start:17834 stop:20314 length:2481 start_codon:yes stop_codon:yes gene_type:complete